MKTIDEILDLAGGHAELPSQAIIDAMGDYEDEVRAKVLELETELAFAKNAVLEIREWTPEQWNRICAIQLPVALWISGEQMDRLMKLESNPE